MNSEPLATPAPERPQSLQDHRQLRTHPRFVGAAFSYDDANQRPFYTRPETIDEFDSWLNYELERDLHDRGYQNIVVRELTDALLRTLVEEDLLSFGPRPERETVVAAPRLSFLPERPTVCSRPCASFALTYT